MRPKDYKGRCVRQSLSKCSEIVRTYDKVQTAFARMLEDDTEVSSFQCNVPLEDFSDGNYLDAAKLMSRIPFSASVEEYRRKALKALDSEMDECSGSEKDLILFMIVREQAERDTKYQQLYIRFSNAFSGR